MPVVNLRPQIQYDDWFLPGDIAIGTVLAYRGRAVTASGPPLLYTVVGVLRDSNKHWARRHATTKRTRWTDLLELRSAHERRTVRAGYAAHSVLWMIQRL